MAEAQATQGHLLLDLRCLGMQHSVLTEYAKTGSNLPFLLERWSRIRGEWHSNECLFFYDPEKDSKSQCAKCFAAYKNINRSRVPHLYGSVDDESEGGDSEMNMRQLILARLEGRGAGDYCRGIALEATISFRL